ncbi:hypothetical protein BU23DRAFT_559316 [Bimuria novae-zelandiae CBS 107.79]|uniref:Uncharacterized protein n=1 Tax=Bimuria novae-zelandiae CBS 107.79 TaxID=1447943 RepID=A0A6A5UX99_9PLEO|nr:hypothetical protein BU23DRAFT_559316 [Bimuria novae-zelandiae CBS 107.79]
MTAQAPEMYNYSADSSQFASTVKVEATVNEFSPGTSVKANENSNTKTNKILDGSLFTVWLSALCALTLLILTSIYAGNSSLLAGHRSIGRSPGNVLLVLRVLSELAGVMMATTIAGTLEVLQWTLISRQEGRKGMSFTDYLVMHAGTGVSGLIQLAFGRGVPKLSSRFWSMTRLIGIAMVPLLNVVIMSNVNTAITYDKLTITAPVTGYGVGTFNASLAAIWHPMADLLFSTNFMYFLSDGARVVDITAPAARARCNDGEENCVVSYYVSGGSGDFAPALLASGDSRGADAFLAEAQPGFVFDFTDGSNDWQFADNECSVFGADIAAWALCLKDGTEDNEIKARLIDCPADVASLFQCHDSRSWLKNQGFSTSLHSWYRSAEVAYSRVNDSILTHSFEGSPPQTPASIPAAELLTAFILVFKSSNQASPFANALTLLGVGNNTAATPIYAWWYFHGASRLANADATSRRRGISGLQSMLGLAIYHCQPKAFGEIRDLGYDNTTSVGKAILASFPTGVQGTPVFPAALRYIIVIDYATLIAYIVLGGATLILCFAVLVTVTFVAPSTKSRAYSSFPILDFLSKCEVVEQERDNRRSVISMDDFHHQASENGQQGIRIRETEGLRVVLTETNPRVPVQSTRSFAGRIFTA